MRSTMIEYGGPIEVGMRFLWGPMWPHATEHLIVTRVDVTNGVTNGETLITSRSWEPTSLVSGGYTGREVKNGESRFREAVMLVVDDFAEAP